MSIDPVERARLDPDDLDARMSAAVRLAEGADGKPFDICLGEALEGTDWLSDTDIEALCLAAARDARAELLSWLGRRDGDLAGRLGLLLARHGLADRHAFGTGLRAAGDVENLT